MEGTSDHPACFDLISGQRRGILADLQRGGLRLLSRVYASLLALRNFRYDIWGARRSLPIPVISVGNLTVGGTGKTPMTIWLCQRLLERGRKPAVLSRGYKASREGLADELLMLSRRCPEAVAVAHPDRYRAGRLAIQEFGTDVALLDDGFQHRRLERNLDIVLIDTTRPFGFGHVLPRGLLREPVANLLRADAIILTRCDQCSAATVAEVEAEIRHWIDDNVPVLRAAHRPTGFVTLNGEKATFATTLRYGVFAGIARPDAFARTLADLNVQASHCRWWPDHHVYTEADAVLLNDWARHNQLDGLITTEKDAVKLAHLDTEWSVPVYVLRVEIDLLDDGGMILDQLLDEVLADCGEE